MNRVTVMLLSTVALACAGVGLVSGVHAQADAPRENAEVAQDPGDEGRAPREEARRVRFDVCDVSYLWPVPETEADVEALISADEDRDASKAAIWPKVAFERMLELVESEAATIKHPGGKERKIHLQPEFRDRKTWKVVSFRADPSAPGGHSLITAKFGESPQLRVILQPVTVAGGEVKVHDVTTHLVYTFVKAPQQAEASPSPLAVADEVKFRVILDDLAELKSKLKQKGIDTQGVPLGVHPGLKRDPRVAGFADEVEAFLKEHVNEKNLKAMAMMGLPTDLPEPWIFFAAFRLPNGTFDPAPIPALGRRSAQMLSFIDGEPKVSPTPLPTNRNPMSGLLKLLSMPPATRRGVATAALFAPNIDRDNRNALNALAVIGQDANGNPIHEEGDRPLKNRDIPDLIANPQLAHFFNTDCISCHSESARRAHLKISDGSAFRYERPEGISGIDTAVLPTDEYNVRCFGWFPPPFGGDTKATVTMRTANETADCVEVINRKYLAREE